MKELLLLRRRLIACAATVASREIASPLHLCVGFCAGRRLTRDCMVRLLCVRSCAVAYFPSLPWTLRGALILKASIKKIFESPPRLE